MRHVTPWGYTVSFPERSLVTEGTLGETSYVRLGMLLLCSGPGDPSSVKWDRVVEKIGSEALLALTSYKFIISFLLDPSG